MHSFTDSTGATWELNVNPTSSARVRALVGYKLSDLLTARGAYRLASKPHLLTAIVYALCKPKADEQGIDAEAFGRRLVGEDAMGLARATDALIGEMRKLLPRKGVTYA